VSVCTVTVHECDWCEAAQETVLRFPTEASRYAILDLPKQWARAQFERERYDLCPNCTRSFRALIASRSGSERPCPCGRGPAVATIRHPIEGSARVCLECLSFLQRRPSIMVA
jgi:hypothetical protein